MESLGPHCKAAGVSISNGETVASDTFQSTQLTNGITCEIYQYVKKSNLTLSHFCNLLGQLNSNINSVNQATVVSRVESVLAKKRKLTSKKKVKGVKNVGDLLSQVFDDTSKTSHSKCVEEESSEEKSNPIDIHIQQDSCMPVKDINLSNSVKEDKRENDHKTSPDIYLGPSSSTQGSSNTRTNEVCTQTDRDENDLENNTKSWNLKKYLVNKQTRKLRKIDKQITAQQEHMNDLKIRAGHYSVKNVNKRDETARKNLHLLRNAQRLTQLKERKNNEGKNQIETFRARVKELEERVKELEEEKSDLKDKDDVLSEKLAHERQRKLNAQKLNSKLRRNVELIKNSPSKSNTDSNDEEFLKVKDTVQNLNQEVKIRDAIICDLEQKAEELKTSKDNIIKTKNQDGSYSESVRLCVIELAGLEVATEKVSPIIQTVFKHLIGCDIPKNELPNGSTCQRLIDEGHYLAKVFIAGKLNDADNWGLCRDGTTRKKQKIVDTSIALDSGDVISLGFRRVARETADTINKVTKSHLEELGSVSVVNNQNHEYVARALTKLSFTMSDRASNEKKADKLLDEWKQDLLSTSNIDSQVVHHFHCSAHVLLGFHSYAIADIKSMETDLASENGPIGRDKLPVFNGWSKRETVVGRTVRVASDCFGPAGEHNGVRDRWEAFCCENGVKSLIGNYRDNRFNALFKTSAEVFLHRTDFLSVIKTVDKPNLKLKAISADLESKEVIAMLQCLGLFYLKFTGPYWNVITSGKVTYMGMSEEVTLMKEYLENCEISPAHLIREDGGWTSADHLDISTVPHHARLQKELCQLDEMTRDLLFKCIKLVAGSMLRTVKKQLVDFLPDGIYHQVTDKTQIQRTKFAPVTNLSCEHHFGDLDSSQRRRPSASFHHHSSIQLLKRNRCQMMKWIGGMKPDYKSSLLSSARKEGPNLRNEHMREEKKVLKDIHQDMFAEKPISKKRKSVIRCGGNKKRKQTVELQIADLPHAQQFQANEYVAVAYEDSWYPGVVDKVLENNSAIVNFMSPCRQSGQFQWPQRSDKQTVNMKFVLKRNFIPNPINSGRQWLVTEQEEIDRLYMNFTSCFFDE